MRDSTNTGARECPSLFNVLIGTCVVVVGIVFAYIASIWPIAQSLLAQSWQKVPCRIVASEIKCDALEFVYQYQLDGKQYQGDKYDYRFLTDDSSGLRRKVVERHPPGSERTCYVNPKDLSMSVFNPQLTSDMYLGLFSGAFFCLAGVGAIRKQKATRPSSLKGVGSV